MTIIVPVYKVEKYLRRCLDSLVNQTYKNLEIILVDDGSPDNCGAICDEFVQKDSRISVIHKENGGLGSARNAGLEICNGVYVLFVDSDDWVENNYVEVMLDYKTENNIVCCGYNAVYSGEVITNCIGEIKKYTALSFIDTMLTFGLENANGTASNPIGNYMWNKMWSKSFFVSTKF